MGRGMGVWCCRGAKIFAPRGGGIKKVQKNLHLSAKKWAVKEV